ncbi:three component ABC system middle component [Kitasatospora sp. NPDC059327]|uniref:three component ABC system middle component n=1 Tax=Kitasatospora sp. NPDC059327 TaxID=3346803 RepID=UPI003689BFD3
MTLPPTRQDQAPRVDTAWGERPPLTSAMFNPALIACLLREAALVCSTHAAADMPWALSYLAIPLVLHRGTREALPARPGAVQLAAWVVRKNPVLRAGFPAQAQAMVDPVRAGLRFALRHEVLELAEDRLRAPARRIREPGHAPVGLDEILKRARTAGGWLSTVDTVTAFSLLGVAP